MNNILFICIGNICRSPIAEGLFKHAMPKKAVCSAGIGALVGEPADPLSIQLMWEHGIDIGAHPKSKQIPNVKPRSAFYCVYNCTLAADRHLKNSVLDQLVKKIRSVWKFSIA